jgi:hypothetical protein
MRLSTTSTLTLLVALAGALACNRAPETAGAAPPTTTPPPAPISSRGEAVPPAPMAQVTTPGAQDGQPMPVAFDLPPGWERQPPSSSMRIAQATIPGDGGPGELAVFYFGPGGGGGVDANLERWIGQMQVEAGGPEPRRDRFQVGDFAVTTVEVAGTLMPSGMGSGPDTPQPGSLLFGAVVEGPGGPWFFKATGPAATLAAQREAFIAMLRGLRAHA